MYSLPSTSDLSKDRDITYTLFVNIPTVGIYGSSLSDVCLFCL